MRILSMLLRRARALFRGGAVDRELADEMAAHLQQLTDEHVARGMTPDAARAAAQREFGSVAFLMDESRDARGVAPIANVWSDVRYGTRLMRRSPGFAAVAMITIALGIGATTAMFNVVYSVLLQPLPYREPERLVNLWTTAPRRGMPRFGAGLADIRDLRARSRSFEDVAVLRPIANFNLTGQGEPERLFGARVSANLFPILGATPLLGRTFAADEDQWAGGTHDHVALLTYPLWVRRFGGDPSVVGRTIDLSGAPFTVVGVMRQDFAYPSAAYQIYVPLTFDPDDLVGRQNFSFLSVARLGPGVTMRQAQAEQDIVAAQLEREHPRENDGIGFGVTPMLDDLVSNVRRPLYLLLAAVAVMLLIGCANLANLLVARAVSRRRELAVRAALGAGRGRLIAQSIAELQPMLAAGGAAGLGAAYWAVAALVPLLPADWPRLENVGVHWPVVAASAALLAGIAAVVGIWPALEASRGGTGPADASRGNSAGRARSRTRDALVVFQIAATLWLVVGAALLLRSFVEVRKVNPGFSADHVYSLHVAIPRGKYPSDENVAAFGNRLLDRVRVLPDVVSAALVNRVPLAGGTQTGPIEFEGLDPQPPALGNVDWRSATPDYFRTIAIPLLSGRSFTSRDGASAPLVAIVDEQLASLFRGGDPIGRRARIPVSGQPWLTIVGVVGHIRHDRLEEDTRPQIYFPFEQRTQDRMAMVVRTRSEPAAIAPGVAAAIRSVDPEQPIYDARPLEAVVDRSLGQRWVQTTLLAGFAAMAVLLASVGVYGVIAYGVGQRTREFGIRLALGARRSEIVALVMRRGAKLFAYGAAIGLAGALASARVLNALLFQVSGFDPASFIGATAILMTIALLACAVPARRAASVDAAIALRAE
jgi:putative ABC transport system permease protein